MPETLFLIKLQAEKIRKFTRAQLCRSLVFNKVADSSRKINIKWLIHFHFFVALVLTKSKLYAPLEQFAFTYNCKVR